jgi:aminobenzoyl-glutamate utilization protein B
MSIGHKGMMQASKTLAATMVDLFDDPSARAAVRAEFEARAKGFVYKPAIPDGPPRVPSPKP